MNSASWWGLGDSASKWGLGERIEFALFRQRFNRIVMIAEPTQEVL